MLEPFGITQFYPDGWGAYERNLESNEHSIGKQNTQKIENKHLNLRTRPPAFSKKNHLLL